MATRGTIAAGIYPQRLRAVVDEVITPSEAAQRLIDLAIANVKGSNHAEACDAAKQAVDLLAREGSEAVLLACTELPVALAEIELRQSLVVDATDALARACVKASLGQYEPAKAG